MDKKIKELLIKQVELLDKKFYETNSTELQILITQTIVHVYLEIQELWTF